MSEILDTLFGNMTDQIRKLESENKRLANAGLDAQIEANHYREALENIVKHIAKETPSGWIYTEPDAERCPAYLIAKSALGEKKS